MLISLSTTAYHLHVAINTSKSMRVYTLSNSNPCQTSHCDLYYKDVSASNFQELEEPRREKPSSRTNAMFEPPFGPEFDAVAWVEAKTTRLFNKILADGLGSQDRHKKPAGIADHPIFPFHKKSYMTRQYHSLNRFTAPSTKVHGSFTSSPSTSKEWNRKVEETLVQDAIRQSDKRELMTINSRPASVTSPGIVHVARYQVSLTHIPPPTTIRPMKLSCSQKLS